MYRRPKFLELLLEIRREMAHEADYDVDLFVEMMRHGRDTDEGKLMVSDMTTAGAPSPPKRGAAVPASD
jgi:hypothetical protein